MAATGVIQRDKFVEELKREFPEDYIWVDDETVVFTMTKARASFMEFRENETELHLIIQKHRHIFGDIDSVNMPGKFRLQITFYSKGVCPTCGRL